MYKIPANTLFLGKNIVYVPQCHSTNTLATDLSQKEHTPEGTIVITDDQTAGRGQRGSTWLSTPGMNLTVSVILHPRFIAPRDQFQISQAVSLAVADYVAHRAEAHIAIKWPNDILIGERKLAGILIENHISAASIQSSVVGMGININQESFPYPKATSLFAETGSTFDLSEELALLLGSLEARYLELRQGSSVRLQNEYLQRLYRYRQLHRFRSAGREWEGTITGIDEAGRLRVKEGDSESVFGVKEIEFL